MAKPDEMILAIPRSLFDRLGAFEGLCFDVAGYLPPMLDRANNRFLARSLAEQDPAWKQIIPYVLFVHAGRVLHYVRSKKGGESRLHRKGSIGIGGHMNDQDEGLFALDEAAYLEGVRREIHEELRLPGPVVHRAVALLNDDSNEVGRVHLGVVHVVVLASPEIAANDPAISEPRFLTPDELRVRRPDLESWSQICVDGLDHILAAAAPA